MQDLEWASHGSIHVQATDRERILHPELRDCIGSPTYAILLFEKNI